MSAEALYALPVAGLLTIGDPNNKGVAAQIAALGLGQEHVPELVCMAIDPELNSAPGDSPEVWAPLHALRALKGLDASAHAAELMPLVEFDDDDWVRQELPKVFGLIGQPALPPLRAYLADRSRSKWAHSLVVHSLGQIAEQHPQLRDEVVALLSDVLYHAEQYDELTCSFAMDALADLEAAEALPAIRHAFELDKIDPMVRGPWDVIVDQIGGEIDPDDPLIALSRQRDAERRERFFPSHLRRQLNEALGIESESPFARLMRERGVIPDNLMAPLAGQVAPQQVEDRARNFESYCDDPSCDCRRVLINVYRSDDFSKIWATISYGWEPIGFYRRWLGDHALADELKGPALDQFQPQTVYAPALRGLFATLLHDGAYVERLRRHYALVKGQAQPTRLPRTEKVSRGKRKR